MKMCNFLDPPRSKCSFEKDKQLFSWHVPLFSSYISLMRTKRQSLGPARTYSVPCQSSASEVQLKAWEEALNRVIRLMPIKPLQRFVFEKSSQRWRSFDFSRARNLERPLPWSWGEVMAATAVALLRRRRLPAGAPPLNSPLFGHSSLCWRAKQLTFLWWAVAQVLPGPLSCHVSKLHISAELVDQ